MALQRELGGYDMSPAKPTHWVYLLVYRDTFVKPELLEGFLRYRPEIADWVTYFPNSYFIKSHLAADSLAEVLKGFFRKEAWFIVLDTNIDKAGWIPKAAWDFIATANPPNPYINDIPF
jgi:hypothetical protein